MADLPINEVVDQLIFKYDLLIKSSQKYPMLQLSGIAKNEDVEAFARAFQNILTYSEHQQVDGLIIHIAELYFCYSACLKAMMNALMDCVTRPATEIIIGTSTWQITSVRAMGGMMRNAVVVPLSASTFLQGATSSISYDRSPDPPQSSIEVQTISCNHPTTDTREEHFFAPTGSGSIKTYVFCTVCGHTLRESSEYFD